MSNVLIIFGNVRRKKIKDNPYGSTAGAGSGEFHIYRHARAREKERLKALDEEEKEQVVQKEFDDKLQKWKQEETDKLDKKRKKRIRNKSSKLRKKNMSLSGVISSDKKSDLEEGDVSDDDEFDYTPLHVNGEKSEENSSKESEKKASNSAKDDSTNSNISSKSDPIRSNDNCSREDKNHISDQEDAPTPSLPQPPLPFKNDGSFLEMMKKMQNSNNDGN